MINQDKGTITYNFDYKLSDIQWQRNSNLKEDVKEIPKIIYNFVSIINRMKVKEGEVKRYYPLAVPSVITTIRYLVEINAMEGLNLKEEE